VFADVDNAARIAQEEIFGPVLTVTAYDSDGEAIEITNDALPRPRSACRAPYPGREGVLGRG
jgi:acyl-CoA reductase-like NAD-dependent aldehyde dehydrogenase